MLKKLVADLNKYEMAEIVFKTGLSVGTVNAIRNGSNDNPTIKTVEKLQQFIETKENNNE